MPVEAFLLEKSQRVEASLEGCMSAYRHAPSGLIKAMQYSLFAGGKRLRPALALGACELICGDDAPALPAACALEMIHTYSLIHDDLPSMDNDDFRRGRPTSHKQFTEATAILAGDALLTMAFYELGRTGRADAVALLAEASGVAGMVGGQFYDMQAEGVKNSLEHLQQIHACKTGALITVSLHLGALFGNASKPQLDALIQYGRHLGMLFQITDDILDVTGDAARIGKSTGKDAQSAKATYPAIVGLDKARFMAQEAADAALAALAFFGNEADVFRGLTHYVLLRDH
jgi:geranylgeranyl diphosphate synthase, type II